MKLIVCLCAAAILPIGAQQVTVQRQGAVQMAAPGTPGAGADVMFTQALPAMPAGVADPTVAFIRSEWVGQPQTVKNAPYAADIISESVQSLADGNRIAHKNSQTVYRDSEGRTRREVSFTIPGDSGESHTTIFIEDPVASVHYILNAKDKTAQKMPAPPRLDAANTKFYSSETSVSIGGSVAGQSAGPVSAGVVAYAGKAVARPENVNTQDLGTQVMDGLQVKGTKTTFTIPAGQMGNDRDIVTTTESWYSDELKLMISSKRTDPRFGDSTTKATNLRRVEPARDLFEVPADYKTVEPQRMLMEKMEKKRDLL